MRMEDAKPSVSPSNSGFDDNDAVESRFKDFCKGELSLSKDLEQQAILLLRETKHMLVPNVSAIGSGTLEEVERSWFAFILFSVKKLSEGQSARINEESRGNNFNLCQILRSAKLNIVDFLKEMPQFLLKAGSILCKMYGADWEKRIEAKEMQTNFVHMRLLSKYYKHAYEKFFLSGDLNGNITGYMSEYHRFGWLLFLALRSHAFSQFKDLVTCTNGLISILSILILHVPIRFRKISIHDSSAFVKKCDKGVNLLASLCDIYQTTEDELRTITEEANNLIIGILKKKPCPASDCKKDTLDNIDPEGLLFFEDLMEEPSLSTSLLILERDYDEAINNRGVLDERVFFSEDSLLGSGSLSGGAINISGTKRKFDAIASPSKTITSPLSPPCSPASPLNGSFLGTHGKMAPTPVSTAMTTAKWLRTVISPLPSEPSSELKSFFSSCDKDVTTDIMRRAHIILEAIFPSSTPRERRVSGSLQGANLMDNIWAVQRRKEALKLYYRVLEAMCRAECQILHNLTSLLTNERFHRCMLACSAELVLATHKTVTMLFPAVLERTGITAFDLSKVIESFVRHEETLPRELKRHLNSLEELLLESMAWEKGSSLYNSLIVARPSVSTEINRLGLLAEPMPSLDEIATRHNISMDDPPFLHFIHKNETVSDRNVVDIQSPKKAFVDYRGVLTDRNSFCSPVKDRIIAFNGLKTKLMPPLQSTFASPTRPNPAGGGETCAETGINIFFSKIVKLAAIRIRSLCERLQLSHQILEKIYCLIQQILTQRTHLFFNRHIDQLILCSFYGVAKISQLTLTFKEIISNYRKQPQCKPQVFRSVFVVASQTNCNGRTRQEHVDIITFYNEVFILAVKPLLVELGSSFSTKSNQGFEDQSITTGPCPGSPRLSPFPNLPDMSPKKVSAVHNVYVSPLRSSKMDVLISPSSKSYYACVGESTHAYQSPSKDLTAINNRLNGVFSNSRKIRLNFDKDLVSDSLVAGSLYPQNGGYASSPVPDASKKTIKSEQIDQ